ncbi:MULTISPECIES: AmiS/UreI family transporter [Burkholderia]|uniref:AmiS/UreI transporter n=1 Tax=Burkholderia aenigmatica TaxID=2015348 RepID=A0A6J5IWL2_9BURK|nr:MULTISPECIES: AmiS/UreI family transporter [Burkholderia]AYQ43881.1 transporter [Burkholderia lata]CAB3962282.1 AmiS/UreI transporter [Burkholderia aenigmatica]VWC71667.1 AmiS/UreI transporter [Burkholderia aenigmatica]VWD28192.1 AmiS/UreI transporter [Burkholderia aenigmatica]
MLGLTLLYVGAVLCLNGLWLLGRIGDREIWVVNIFSGGVTMLVSLQLIFGSGASIASIKAGALTLLFTFTYLWVALNRFNGADGRGLGWFSLFVSVTVIPVAIESWQRAVTAWDVWFAWCWIGWGVLWFLYFVLLALQRPILRLTGVATILAGIVTGWLPGYLLLSGTFK